MGSSVTSICWLNNCKVSCKYVWVRVGNRVRVRVRFNVRVRVRVWLNIVEGQL